VQDLLAIAAENFLTPPVLFFLLGLLAAALRSELALPEALGKSLSIYLMLAIGFKGGAELANSGGSESLALAVIAALLLSAGLPWLAYPLLRLMVRLSQVDSAAIAAHYGSVSIVTFAAAVALLTASGRPYEGYLVVMLALMETPAILSGLLLARRIRITGQPEPPGAADAHRSQSLLKEVLLSGSVLLLLGSFVIGWATGPQGMQQLEPFLGLPFKGVLCLFLLDMGLLAGRRLEGIRVVGARLALFGIGMPLIGAGMGLAAAIVLGLSAGGGMLLMVLAASASYIVVPAAMRSALPKADPALYICVTLAVTFPFNLLAGIPIYLMIADAVLRG
jgi:hypothetical protein